MTFMSVLLPAPFSPMRACTSPSRNSRSTPSSAIVGPNDLEIFDNLSAIIIKAIHRLHRLMKKNLCNLWMGLSFQSVVQRVRGIYTCGLIRGGDCQDSQAL